MSLYRDEVLIDDSNYREYMDGVVDGEQKARGLVPRDFDKSPVGYIAGAPAMKAVNMPLIPESEYSPRIKEMVEQKGRLSDRRMTGNRGKMIPGLDQGSAPYCWGHSTVHGVIMLRALANQVYLPLSAYAVCATIKNGRDDGGWGAQSLEFAMSRGVPTQQHWPQGSRNLSHGTPECWANGAMHKVTEGWVDVEAPVYDRDLSWAQVMTLLLCRIPVVGDFNWWGHSVCLLDPVEIEPGSFGVRIWNSWGEGWSTNGMGVLRGAQARPDSAVAPRITNASVQSVKPDKVVAV